MEKYEISLWENIWVEDQSLENGGYYDENKICVIGADDMNTPVRAIEPKLVDNINGTHTFTFKMYKRYVDNITGETVLNPFDKYLTNERKVKVFWKGYWYDFIIKKIQENSSDKSLIYTCQDLFIYELSKNGYELNFNTDLKNNIGSARKLIKATLDGSTWQFDEENSEEMIQTYEEPVIEATSLNNFETINQTQLDTSFTVQSNKKMLVFYNSIIDIFSLESGESINRDIQLICDNTNTFITELNNNLVIDNYCLLAHMTIVNQSTYFDFKQGNTICFQLQNGFQVSSNYRGERFINTDIQVYDEDLKSYVVECEDIEDANHRVYRAEVTKENNPLKVVNLISNPTNFKNTDGWEPAENNNNEIPVNVKVYPDDFPVNVESLEYNVETALKIKGKVYNNAFSSNVNRFKVNSSEQKQGQLSGIHEGDKYTFRIRGFKNYTIPKEEYVFPEINRTPIEVVEDTEDDKWSKIPIYIYEDIYRQPGEWGHLDEIVGPSDTVGRLLGISGYSNMSQTTFKFGQRYKIVSYGSDPIYFGLNFALVEGGSKIRFSNYRSSQGYGILKESFEVNAADFPAYTTSPDDCSYGFYFYNEFSKIGLAFTREFVSTQVGPNVPVSVTIKAAGVYPTGKSPQEIFGPAKSNALYDLIRDLLRRKSVNEEVGTLATLNNRTFTAQQASLFYREEDFSKYHPRFWKSQRTIPRRVRTYVMFNQWTSSGSEYHWCGPDFMFINNFAIFVDTNQKKFDFLINNIAERIRVDPPVSSTAALSYDLLTSQLNKVSAKDKVLKDKLKNGGYYQVNGTNKELNDVQSLNDEGQFVDSENVLHEFSAGEYVVLITKIDNNIYVEENGGSINWLNYRKGYFISKLYRCENNNSTFELVNGEPDSTNWTYLNRNDTDFPLLENGNSWATNAGGPTEEVIDDDINLYSLHGYSGVLPSSDDSASITTYGLGKVSDQQMIAAARSMGIPISVNAALQNLPAGALDGLTDNQIDALKEQINAVLGEVSSDVRERLSWQEVYSFGCYIQSYLSNGENTDVKYGLQGEFDKLLINTFDPLIARMTRIKSSYNFDGTLTYSYANVEDPEINRFVLEKDYDSDFPDLISETNYLESSDFNFNILLDNQPVFSISEPSIGTNHWLEYTLTAVKNVPLSEIKDIEFYIETNSNIPIWIDNVQLFKNQYIKIGGVDTLIYPNRALQWSQIEKQYIYYEKDNNGRVILEQTESLLSQYPPKTSNYYKIATININRSNRFNILQTIAEAFNGWIYFDIKHNDEGKILLEDGVPKKYVGIQQKKGNNVDVTFEYGIDLKQIQRQIDSNQLTTKIYVLQNSNEFGQNGFCTISRSRQNLTKASFILDLSYFVQAGLINEEQLNKDLYEWYYPRMNQLYSVLDSKEKELIDAKEKILRMQAQLSIYENYLSAAEDELGSLISDKSYFTRGVGGLYNNKKIQGLESSIKEAENEIDRYSEYYESQSLNINNLQNSINALESDTEEYRQALKNLHEKFNNIYWPFIFEGTWIDEKYMDDDQYYLDGLMVAHNSSRPQLTYNINVIRVGDLPEFTSKQFHVGDICYIVDKEFFGFKEDGVTPIKERIIVYEITSYFDSPEKDSITVRNYRSKFDDLFQKIVATTQSLKFAEGEYTRVAKAITPERTISYDLLQDTFSHNENIVLNAANQSVTWDETGITITNDQNTADKTRIIAGGIFITNDGGKTWKNAVRGDGISADILTAGRINSGEIYIYDKEYPMFRWDNTGISAYSCAREEQNPEQEVPTYTVNFSKFVRFDKFGLYGYNNPSNTAYLDDFIPQSEEDIWTNEFTKFGLTWKGFFLKTVSNDGGYVKITTDGDMLQYPNGIIDRKIISSGFGDRETFYLTQNGNAVFSGELKAAKGTFVGESNSSLLTLDNDGLVLKVLDNAVYEDKFRIKYIQTGSHIYPYMELIGGEEVSIILQNEGNLFIGPKNFIGLRGLTVGRKTFESGPYNSITTTSDGVFVDMYYEGSASTPQDPYGRGVHRRTYNVAKALYILEQQVSAAAAPGTDFGSYTQVYESDEILSTPLANFLQRYVAVYD